MIPKSALGFGKAGIAPSKRPSSRRRAVRLRRRQNCRGRLRWHDLRATPARLDIVHGIEMKRRHEMDVRRSIRAESRAVHLVSAKPWNGLRERDMRRKIVTI